MAATDDQDSYHGIREFRFQEVALDVLVFFQILVMNRSYFVWIGSSAGSFDMLDLSMASSTDVLPVSTSLIGNDSDTVGLALSNKLAMKLKTQVYVSFNLPGNQSALLQELERILFLKLIPLICDTKSSHDEKFEELRVKDGD